MTDVDKPAKGGGNPTSPKKRHGRGWLAKRSRGERTWAERKMRSRRYCPPTTAR